MQEKLLPASESSPAASKQVMSEQEALEMCQRLDFPLHGHPETVTLTQDQFAQLFAAMDAHLASSEVQTAALSTLGKLTWKNPAHAAVVTSTECGALLRIAAAMDAHADDYQLQSNACWTLHHVMKYHADIEVARACVLAAQMVRRLQHVKARHPKAGDFTAAFYADAVLNDLMPQKHGASSCRVCRGKACVVM